MPFYELTNTETDTYICIIQGELEDIHRFYKGREGKYSLKELDILNSDAEVYYQLKLYHIVDNDVDYYLLADNMKEANDLYYVHCCINLRKSITNKIVKRRFLRCLSENDELILSN